MEHGPIELGSGLVGGQGGQGGQAAESDLTGGEEAARLCLLGLGSLCATLAKGLFTLELNKIQKLKTRKNKFSPLGCSTSSRSRWAIASCLFRSASGVHALDSGLLVSSVSLGV